MIRRACAVATFLSVLAASSASAQSLPPVSQPVQDWSTNIETVVVTAHRQGPALWHVSANGADVWILGTVAPIPKDLEWNSAEIETVLSGAKIVYLPPAIKAGFFEISWFLLTDLGSLKNRDGKQLEELLPPDLKKRFVAARIKVGEDADRYGDYLPAIAALRIEADFLRHARLDGRAIEERIKRLAGAKRAPVKTMASYEMMPIVHEIPALSSAAQLSCMRDALDDIEIQSVHADAAARAWAVGDLAGMKANYAEIKLQDCFAQTKSFAADREHIIIDAMSAIDQALAKPGKSLVVIGIGPLLRKDGVLDLLHKRGLAVVGPPG